jgi:O-antigen/teichoic acid export membrane protein
MPLVRHSAYYLLGRIATGAVGLVTLIAFTRVLSPVVYGRYAVIIAIASLIAGVGFQWLRQCLVRFGTEISGSRQPLLGTLGVLFAATIVTTLALAIFMALVGSAVHIAISPAELAAVCGLTLAQSWFELSADAARTELRPWRYSVANFLRSLLCLAFGVAAALLTHQVLLVILGMAAGYFLASLVAAPPWLSGLRHVDVATWLQIRRIMAYGIPLAGTLGLQFILDSADRLMLASMRGYIEAGTYSSAYNLAQFSIGTLLGGLGLASLPLAVGAFRAADQGRVVALLERNLLMALSIGVPAIVGLVIIAPTIDYLLLGNYAPGQSAIVTMIVAIGIGMAAIRSYCLDIVFMLHQRTWLQAVVIGASALLNVLLNLALIPRWGPIGAAFATLMAFASALAGSLALGRRYLKIRLPLKDTVKILIASASMGLVVVRVLVWRPGWLILTFAILSGALVYVFISVAVNVAGSRDCFITLLRKCAAYQ